MTDPTLPRELWGIWLEAQDHRNYRDWFRVIVSTSSDTPPAYRCQIVAYTEKGTAEDAARKMREAGWKVAEVHPLTPPPAAEAERLRAELEQERKQHENASAAFEAIIKEMGYTVDVPSSIDLHELVLQVQVRLEGLREKAAEVDRQRAGLAQLRERLAESARNHLAMREERDAARARYERLREAIGDKIIGLRNSGFPNTAADLRAALADGEGGVQ
jgi:DNA repair exonuclease SbcCD ATPase subunit